MVDSLLQRFTFPPMQHTVSFEPKSPILEKSVFKSLYGGWFIVKYLCVVFQPPRGSARIRQIISPEESILQCEVMSIAVKENYFTIKL